MPTLDLDYLKTVIASLHVEIAAHVAANKAKDARIAELEKRIEKVEAPAP